MKERGHGVKGRHDCNLCPDHTRGQDVALFYRLDMETGRHHVILRAHASHFDPAQTSQPDIMRNLQTITRRMREAA